MREKIKDFFSSGPLGAVAGVLSALGCVIVKGSLVGAIANLLNLDPASLAGIVIPMGVFPLFFGAAMLFGYLGGLFGGLYQRRKLGAILGGLLTGLVISFIFTLK